MGTNYYVIKDKCECCKRSTREYHIGKSSGGWAFSFQGYPWNKLTSWKAWKEFLKDQAIEGKPLTDEGISKIFIYCGRDKETFARAIERAHGIGGEE